MLNVKRFSINFSLFMLLAFCFLGARASSAMAASGVERWYFDGSIKAIASTPGATYVGGHFGYVGRTTGSGVPLNAETGIPFTSYVAVESPVSACVADGRGGWFIAGSFYDLGGLTRRGIARILADGRVDPDWVVDASGVYALSLAGGVLYVGGYFESIGGQARKNLAALDAATGAVKPWNPGANGVVLALSVSGGVVYAGGDFTYIGDQMRLHLAALNAATGALTDWNPYPNSTVNRVVATDTAVYVSGLFSFVSGRQREGLAAVSVSTGQATAWNPPHDSTASLLGVADGLVYVGGAFTTIGGQSRQGLAALDAVTAAPTSWNPAPQGSVAGVVASGSTLYVFGGFSAIAGQPRGRLAAFDRATGALKPWNPAASASVRTLAVSGPSLYVGGDFRSLGGCMRRNLAAIESATGVILDWNPDPNDDVTALAVTSSTVYAGGAFTAIGGQPRNRLAALNAATGAVSGWNPGPEHAWSSPIRAMLVTHGLLYVGGDFAVLAFQPRRNLASFDLGTGALSSWSPNPNNPVYAMALAGSRLYVGGAFSQIGGQNRVALAALDPATGALLPWSPQVSAYAINALAVSDSGVYAGGTFRIVHEPWLTEWYSYLAKFDPQSGARLNWGPELRPSNSVNALAVAGSTVFVGGLFTLTATGQQNLAAVGDQSGQLVSMPPFRSGWAVNPIVNDGRFTFIGDAQGSNPVTSTLLVRLPLSFGYNAARGWRGYQ